MAETMFGRRFFVVRFLTRPEAALGPSAEAGFEMTKRGEDRRGQPTIVHGPSRDEELVKREGGRAVSVRLRMVKQGHELGQIKGRIWDG